MRTVFLDRDGVINRKAAEGDYVKNWSEFEFLPGAVSGLRMLSEAGWKLMVVTNQRGIALGRMSADDLADIHTRMCLELGIAGAPIEAVYVCPHDRGKCYCRKPDVGLFLEAWRDWPGLDFRHSVVIGDSLSDMQAATRLKCGRVWIGDNPPPDTDFATHSIEEAAQMMLFYYS
jgi:D-glycero-D-manno-heptose 1,7-bisphosphate phosphatase